MSELVFIPAWVMRDGRELAGAVRMWRREDNGEWRALVNYYDEDYLQYSHWVDESEVRPRD